MQPVQTYRSFRLLTFLNRQWPWSVLFDIYKHEDVVGEAESLWPIRTPRADILPQLHDEGNPTWLSFKKA